LIECSKGLPNINFSVIYMVIVVFFQISIHPIHPDDQDKIIFTCPYGTFAYRRMSFGLCNAPATFQRAMMGIFSDLIENVMEVLWMIFLFMAPHLMNV
jgi:hypothetical protein